MVRVELLISLSLVIAGATSTSSVQPRDGKTDLERDGLAGLVQTVRIKTARFSRKSGEWVQDQAKFLTTVSYDTRGNKIGEDGEDPRPDRPKERHTYDSNGNLVERISYDALGVIGKETYLHDGAGRLTEEISYYPDGQTVKIRQTHTYDAEGKRSQTTVYEAHDPGAGIGRRVYRYDPRGNVVENINYAIDGSISDKWVHTYSYDSTGNWIKRTVSHCLEKVLPGKFVCEPIEVTYRAFTYYEASGRRQELRSPVLSPFPHSQPTTRSSLRSGLIEASRWSLQWPVRKG